VKTKIRENILIYQIYFKANGARGLYRLGQYQPDLQHVMEF